jgi:hypothetical protein
MAARVKRPAATKTKMTTTDVNKMFSRSSRAFSIFCVAGKVRPESEECLAIILLMNARTVDSCDGDGGVTHLDGYFGSSGICRGGPNLAGGKVCYPDRANKVL